ncbi:MAG: L-glutamate gamma-semialdehyde dehydrogenase [Microlunatus sp.]
MTTESFDVTTPGPVVDRSFRAGSPERVGIETALAELRSGDLDLPVIIGGREIRTGRTAPITVPHDHATHLGRYHVAAPAEMQSAIQAAADAGLDWRRRSREERAEPFRRAAELLAGGPWRDRLVAATMLELSKTAAQADGDVGEVADFLTANIANAELLDQVQPSSTPGVSNVVDYRPLEGFVLAISPFNFTSMNNLAFGPALLGNTVIWKPAEAATLVAHLSMQLLREAGLPDGVVNLVTGPGSTLGSTALTHPHLSAVHFTGSTGTFRRIWAEVGANIGAYRDYPRIVGETGGKDFVLVHPSADIEATAVACVRGAYEYQGQKCAAVSRVYAPRSLWPALKDRLLDQIAALRVGDPTEPGVHLGAVISARQLAMHEAVLAEARHADIVLAGGRTDGSSGWFVEPTLLEVTNPASMFMIEEFFGPIMTVYVYDDADWPEVLTLVDQSSEYGLTGAVFATDPAAIDEADIALRYTAGNYYVNDKPTGATVGQQPFGGARASGTNDKAGTMWNLIRFVSPRAVKTQHSPDRTPGLFALD